MRHRFVSMSLPVLLVVLHAGAARADVVGPPPASCLDGTTGNSCHGGPYCAPRTCTADTDCPGGETCRDESFCVASVGCAGNIGPDSNPRDYDRENVTARCDTSLTCTSGACRSLRVCVSPVASGGSRGGGCGCVVIGSPSSEAGSRGLAWAAVAIVGFVWLARRRRGCAPL